VRIYRTEAFFRSFWSAPPHVRGELQRSLNSILARGRYRTKEKDLHAAIVDEWILYFRYPYFGEAYDPDSCVLLRIGKKRA
jgi:hypothetical protein